MCLTVAFLNDIPLQIEIANASNESATAKIKSSIIAIISPDLFVKHR